MKQKLFAKKSEQGMEHSSYDKAEKAKGELKQKGTIVLNWVLTITYTAIVIHFVFKPLTEFVVMIDHYIKFNIINFFFK